MAVPQYVYIFPKSGVGLTSAENKEVLTTLENAQHSRKLPPILILYNKHPRLFGKDPIEVRAKTLTAGRLRVKIRDILRDKFGDKYKVQL